MKLPEDVVHEFMDAQDAVCHVVCDVIQATENLPDPTAEVDLSDLGAHAANPYGATLARYARLARRQGINPDPLVDRWISTFERLTAAGAALDSAMEKVGQELQRQEVN